MRCFFFICWWFNICVNSFFPGYQHETSTKNYRTILNLASCFLLGERVLTLEKIPRVQRSGPVRAPAQDDDAAEWLGDSVEFQILGDEAARPMAASVAMAKLFTNHWDMVSSWEYENPIY